MSIIDVIIIFILAFTSALGFFFGLIRVLGAIITIIISIVAAGIFYTTLAVPIQPYLLKNENLSRIVAFIIIYWVCSLFLSFVIKIVNKLFNLPILKTVNRLLGGIVSLTGAVVILSIFLYLFKTYAWVESIDLLFSQSLIIPVLIEIGSYARWAIPGI